MNWLHFTLISAALCGTAYAQPPSLNILFDGDSISAGSKSTPGHGLDAQTVAALGGGIEMFNVSRGGRPVYECLRLYPVLVTPMFDPAKDFNVILFHAGDNDISPFERTAEQTYASFTAYVAAVHQQGWKIIVTTELHRFKFDAEKQQELESYNAMLLANKAGADVVIDLNADPRLGDEALRADPSIFSRDQIHPSDGGYAVIAEKLASAIKRLAGSPS